MSALSGSHLAPGMPFLHLQIATGEGQWKFLDVIPHFLQSAEEERLADSRTIFRIALFDSSWDFLETIFLTNRDHKNESGNIKYRFGWIGGVTGKEPVTLSDATTGWRTGDLVKPQVNFSTQGSLVHLEITAGSEIKDSKPHLRAWPSKTGQKIRVSEIVAKIGKEMGFKSLTIEQTKGLDDYLQYGQTNFQFLEELLKYAQSERTGRRDYYLAVDGDRLIFRTWPYEGGVARRFHYGRQMRETGVAQERPLLLRPSGAETLREAQGGQVVDFTVESELGLIRMGLLDHKTGISWDPIERKLIRVKGSRAEVTRVATGREVPETEEKSGRSYVLPYERSDKTKEWLEFKLTEAANLTIIARAVVMGEPTLRVGDLTEWIIIKDDGDVHYLSGVYRVLGALHRISNEGFTTELRLGSDGHRIAGLKNPGLWLDPASKDKAPEEDPAVQSEEEQTNELLRSFSSGGRGR